MSEIDPQEFGELKGEVAALKTAVSELIAEVKLVREQLAEARGGWKMLMLIGGAGAVAGGWFIHWFKG